MALTGLTLIALTMLATAAAVAGTILLWSRFGQWRLLSRTVGVLLCEALVVLSVGLIANRHEQFYPSWQALAGNTGTKSTTAPRKAGRLDGLFGPGRSKLAWRPPGSAAWHLTSSAEVAVPPGYRAHPSFPALLALGGRPPASGLVSVVAYPAVRTSAAALADLPALLGVDLRVTGHGWALVASSAQAGLAARLVQDDPGRFAALAVVGKPPAGFRPPPVPGVAVAVARPAAVRGALPPGVTALTGSWPAATAWAVAQTALPLAAPEVLPTAVAS
jgi:lysyl-tRNA synthetase class 2